MIHIKFSRDAAKDIGSLRRETKRGWGEIGLEKFDLKLTARLLSVSLNPRIGPPRNEVLPGLRSLSFPPFVLFYRINAKVIEIVRVYDGRRDYQSILRRMTENEKG